MGSIIAEEFNKVKINNVSLVKILGTGGKGVQVFYEGIDANGKNNYAISFPRAMECVNPEVTLFDANNNEIKDIDAQMENSQKGDDTAKYTKVFIDGVNGNPVRYTISYSNSADNDKCKILEGDMPELQVQLSAVNQGSSRELVLNNISNKDLKINSIKANTADLEFDGTSVDIAHGTTHKILLKPVVDSCIDIEEMGGRELTLEVQYEIIGEASKKIPDQYQININYSCAVPELETDSSWLSKAYIAGGTLAVSALTYVGVKAYLHGVGAVNHIQMLAPVLMESYVNSVAQGNTIDTAIVGDWINSLPVTVNPRIVPVPRGVISAFMSFMHCSFEAAEGYARAHLAKALAEGHRSGNF